MKKITLLIIILLALTIPDGFAQIAGDGSYFWNSISITYSFNDKTDLVFANKDHYSNQIDRLDYFHFELIGYRKLTKTFLLGLGVRQTESYKTDGWNPGKTYMLYGVFAWNPWNIKIKFANRLVAKASKTSDNQYGLDNITNVDFFTGSTSKLPRPYLMDELFTSLDIGKVQTIRLYGGFRLLNKKHWGLDIYYCYWKTRSTAEWKDYNVFGLNTKFRI
jgi:hypothetical protein